jgi:hypothetical protein
VVGLATWFVLARAPQSELPQSQSPAASAASEPSVVVPPVIPVPASSAPAPSSAPSLGPAASAVRPKPAPVPEPPGELDALLEGPSWASLLAVLIVIVAGGLALRRFGKRGRARSVVHEVYAA